MANRRMISKQVTAENPKFRRMSIEAKLLYYSICVTADDFGVVDVDAQMVLNRIPDTSMTELADNGYITELIDGMYFINHWYKNNQIQTNRLTISPYYSELVKRNLIPNNYRKFDVEQNVEQNVEQDVEQNDSTDKYSIDKYSTGKVSSDKDSSSSNTEEKNLCIEHWNKLSVFGITKITKIADNSKRAKNFISLVNEFGIDEVLEAIDSIEYSQYLQGKNKSSWKITFDWFIQADNFSKVLEGNYGNVKPKVPEVKPKQDDEELVGDDWMDD